MKTPALIAVTLTAFAAGAWLGREERVNIAAEKMRGTALPAERALLRASGESRENERWSHLVSALQEPLFLRQRVLMLEAVGDLSAAEVADFLLRADRLPVQFRKTIIHALATRWFELDAPAATAWVRARHNLDLQQIWAAHDPAAALRDRAGWPEENGGLDIWKPIIAGLAGPGGREQAAMFLAMPPARGRDDFLAAIFETWAQSEPATAFDSATLLPAGELRERVQHSLLLDWVRRDPASALARTRTLLPGLRAGMTGSGFINAFTDRLAKIDPATALSWVTELPAEMRPFPAIAAAREWAKTEPAAALDWCRANGIEVVRHLRGSGSDDAVLSSAMRAHPAETTAWALALPPGDDRDRLLERALHERLNRTQPDQLFTGDPKSFRELHRQTPPAGRARIERRMGEGAALLQSNP